MVRSTDGLDMTLIVLTRRLNYQLEGVKEKHPHGQAVSPPDFRAYCAFDIFQKVVFCLSLNTKEVNLQTFVMI